jgi:hypothetical protein
MKRGTRPGKPSRAVIVPIIALIRLMERWGLPRGVFQGPLEGCGRQAFYNASPRNRFSERLRNNRRGENSL